MLQALTEAESPDELKKAWERARSHWPELVGDDEAVEMIRKTVSEVAVRGMLVRQSQEDEPASALLGRFLAEKAIRLKDRRPQSATAHLQPACAPFSLPATWSWVRLGDVALDLRYGTSKKCSRTASGLAVLRIPNVANGNVSLDDLKYATFSAQEREAWRLGSGDLLIVRSNGSTDLVGRVTVVPVEAEHCVYAGYLVD